MIPPPPPTSMPPPPPPMNSLSSLSEQRKRKKRFELAPQQQLSNKVLHSGNLYDNPFIPKSPLESLANDIQIVPYIHYGLNRNMTIFTILDSDNILTKSPTLVSFGGSSFELGFQKTLLILDLDPATKYLKDGGLDTSFEYEWKQIHTTNNQIFDSHLYGHLISNMIYSKKHQKIYLFGGGWYKSWVACLCLKDLNWKIKNLAINSQFYTFKFVNSSLDDEQFMICLLNRPCSIATFNYDQLEELFKDNNSNEGSLFNNNGNSIEINNPDINYRMVTPISSENRIAIYGNSLADFQNIHILDSNNLELKFHVQDENPQNSYILEIPATLHEFYSKQALILSDDSFYKVNLNNGSCKLLKYTKPAIVMKCSKLFTPFMANFKSRKGEDQLLHITNNDVLFIIKLDYNNPSNAFRNKLMDCNFTDVSINIRK